LRCNCFDRSNNSEFQFIDGGHRGLANNVLNVPHRKKSSGVISGERGVHGIGPSRPTQRPGQCMSRNSFHIPLVVSFCCFRFQNYRPRNPDNHIESHCTINVRQSYEYIISKPHYSSVFNSPLGSEIKFCPEDGGNRFRRSAGTHLPNCTASHYRRLQS
jgi:hypothetical protein